MRNGRTDPTAGEALTSLYAVKMCKELGGQAIILEGDAKNVVDMINSEDKCGEPFWPFGGGCYANTQDDPTLEV